MPTITRRAAMLTGLCATLAGCALPRGAAFESEILEARGSSARGAPPDFAVEPVTRDSLDRFAKWPRPGNGAAGWIAKQPGPANRIIQPGDVLAITLWTNENNSLLTSPGQKAITMNGVTVSSTGEVFMPYIGDVKVSGMSPDHARETIEARVVEVSPSAQVQLEITEGAGSLVSLVGGVTKPGTYPMRDQSFTVLSLIAEGGGVPPNLNNPQIRLMRGGKVYATSIDRLYADPGLDTTLRPGDKVIVQEDERYFLSLGAAGTEAQHPFPRDTISALEAVSIIGGVSDTRANPKGILVLRNYPAAAVRSDGDGPSQERVVFTIDLTSADGLFSAGQFQILSGDLVYATESPITAASTILSVLGNTIGIVRTTRLVTE